MRSLLLLLTAATSLLAVAVCQSPVQEAPSPGAAALALRPVDSEALDKVIQGLDAVQKFADIFASDIFKTTPVGLVAELLAKSLSFVISFMNLFNGGQSESAEMKYMRDQFGLVHEKLDKISLQISEVMDLIDWSTTKVTYAQYELQIVTASKLFDSYVESSPEEREFRKRQFVDYFASRRFAPFKLYQAIEETDYVIASNLAASVTHYTKNHRRQITSFLLATTRLILRGAQLQIAYERLEHSEEDANVVEADWTLWTEVLTHRIKSVEDEVKKGYIHQLNTDVMAILASQHRLSNRDFSTFVYKYLTDKFDWRLWITVVMRSGVYNSFSNCGGRFQGTSSRVIATASTDPDTTTFTKSYGDSILSQVTGGGLPTHPKGAGDPSPLRNELERKTGLSCDTAAFRGVVCFNAKDCDLWFTARGTEALAHREIKVKGHSARMILFG